MKRVSWKKFTGMILVLIIATIARSLNWLDIQWYGIILTFNSVAFFMAQTAADKDEIKVSAGINGISVEEKKNENN